MMVTTNETDAAHIQRRNERRAHNRPVRPTTDSYSLANPSLLHTVRFDISSLPETGPKNTRGSAAQSQHDLTVTVRYLSSEHGSVSTSPVKVWAAHLDERLRLTLSWQTQLPAASCSCVLWPAAADQEATRHPGSSSKAACCVVETALPAAGRFPHRHGF